MPERLSLFATASRGTEDLLSQELIGLGASKVRQDRGGVRFLANLHEALRVCLHTRLAMRVLYPLGELEAQGAEGLYEAASSVAWEEHLSASSTFAVDASLRDSEHTHSGFVALKIKDAIVDRMRRTQGQRPNVDPKKPDVSVVAHLSGTKLSLSLDLAGAPLHRRGYRARTTAAPLKETLAAAVLAASKYVGDEPAADPMCGSGTLIIEAAMLAMRKAPGFRRTFGVERWPHLGAQARAILDDARREAKAQERASPHRLFARDIDEEALEAAEKNAHAAGVADAITFELLDATKAAPPPGPPGLLVSNPPYGERLGTGGQKGMKAFYFKLGESLGQWAGWRLALLEGNEAFESAFHSRPSQRRTLWNGPIECRLLEYRARS